MISATCTLQNVGFIACGAVVAWVDDVEVELELTWDGNLRTVIFKDADSKREVRITEAGIKHCINQAALWAAAQGRMERDGDDIRERAGVIKPRARRPEYTGPEYAPLSF